MSPRSPLITRVRCEISNKAPNLRKRAALRNNPSSFPSSSNTARSPKQKLASISGISSSVREQKTAQTMLPADDPEIIRGSRRASHNVLSTPMWFIPKVAPPDNNKALLPKACLVDSTCSRIYLVSRPSHLAFAETSSNASRVSKADVIYLSIRSFVPICVCLYSLILPMSPNPRVSDVRTRNSIRSTSQLILALSSCFSRASTSGAS